MKNNLLDLGPRKKHAKSLAQKVLKEIRAVEAPVSLQRVIEHIQTTRTLDVLKMDVGDKVSGLLVVCKKVDGEYATIGFNQNHSWHRRRFTIAHEIGHLLLGHTHSDHVDDSHNEAEANAFAGELLMPTAFIKNDYKKLPNLEKLSKLYRVSSQALTIKLMDARLV